MLRDNINNTNTVILLTIVIIIEFENLHLKGW